MAIQPLNPESLAERMAAELNANPEARRLLLRALLTDEFLMLPAKVDRLMDLPDRVKRLESDVSDLKAGQAELQAGQAGLSARQTRMEGDIADLKAGQAGLSARQTRMEGDIADLKAGQAELQAGQAELQAGQAELQAGQAEIRAVQARMQGQLGNLLGNAYERSMIQSIAHTVNRALGMQRAKVLKGGAADAGELSAKVVDAEMRGLITREQGDGLFRADAVISGISGSDRSPLHAIAEISVTIGQRDVERAKERAATLSAVMGEPAKGLVIGDSISEPDRRRAERSEVAVELVRQHGA